MQLLKLLITESLYKLHKGSGSHLSSHAVSSIVFSAAQVLTNVFGMGTGVTPVRIATGNLFDYLGNQTVM